MNELISASAALASLIALTRWARTVPTRAWGGGTAPTTAASRHAWVVVLATLALQALAATAAAGLAAGLALVVAAWMVLGWLLVLAMNQWPAPSLRWGRRLGALGGAGCVFALVGPLLRAWGVT